MNLLFSFTDEWLSLPVWAWIVIAAVVLILIIVIIAVAARSAKKKRAARNEAEGALPEEPAPAVAAPAEEEQPAPAEAQPAVKAPAKSEPERPAPVVAEAQPEQPAPVASPEERAEVQAEEPAETLSAAPRAPMPKVYHITKRTSDGKWQIKFNRGKKAIKLFDTQMQAIEYAKALAQNQEASIMIHKEDGTFRKLRYDKPSK